MMPADNKSEMEFLNSGVSDPKKRPLATEDDSNLNKRFHFDSGVKKKLIYQF